MNQQRMPRPYGWALLAVLGVVTFGAGPGRAHEISQYGDYTIVTGVPWDEAQLVHESLEMSGLTPLYVDGYNSTTGSGLEYCSIWMTPDGIQREIFLDLSPFQVQYRMDNYDSMNNLLQVDAWTQNEGLWRPDSDYKSYYYWEIHCCGVFTEEKLPERAFVWAPLSHQSFDEDCGGNKYWLAGWPTIQDVNDELVNEGFDILCASVVRPWIPVLIPIPGWHDLQQACAGSNYEWSDCGVVALYERSDLPTKARWEFSLDKAEDFIDNERESGWGIIDADVYQHAQWVSDVGEEGYRINYGVITRRDPRIHAHNFGLAEDEVDVTHMTAHYYSLRPIAITASRKPGTYGVFYNIFWRELDTSTNPDIDPVGGQTHGGR